MTFPPGGLAHSWLKSLEPLRVDLGLGRIEALLDRLGRPERAFHSLHVAGTNGKGSTCAMVAAALRAAGRRTGLYSSPHLVRFEERIQVDGEAIEPAALEAGLSAVREAARGLPLTYFEAGTALAFWHFREAGVQAAVVETGLGGRLDATNVVSPLAVGITALGLDHTEILGPTLAHIAREKAGIFKPAAPAVVAEPPPEARPVLEARARELSCPLFVQGRDFALQAAGGSLRYRGPRWRLDGVRVGLLGPHQLQNAAVALALLEQADPVLGIGAAAALRGVAEARWPGRLERFFRGPIEVVLDGAHNPHGAAALARAIRELWPSRPIRLVFGLLADKDATPMLEAIFPLSASAHLAPPDSPRARMPEEILAAASALCPRTERHATVRAALEAALSEAAPGDLVLACGSLYLVGEVRALLAGA